MSKCDCVRPTARTDRDGDVICAQCRRVLRVGPMGINGIGFGGIQSYSSPKVGRVSQGAPGPESFTVEDWE